MLRWFRSRRLLDCPCCGFPTLGARRQYEICPVCGWEDDGQDDADADVVMGGPNGQLSLTAARANFAEYGYSQGLARFAIDAADAELLAEPAEERGQLDAYVSRIRKGQETFDRPTFRRIFDRYIRAYSKQTREFIRNEKREHRRSRQLDD
jgi:hypothetical protein